MSSLLAAILSATDCLEAAEPCLEGCADTGRPEVGRAEPALLEEGLADVGLAEVGLPEPAEPGFADVGRDPLPTLLAAEVGRLPVAGSVASTNIKQTHSRKVTFSFTIQGIKVDNKT